MVSPANNKRPASWLMIVLAILVIGCCCLSIVVGGVWLMRSRGTTLEDWLSGPAQEGSQSEGYEVQPQEESQAADPAQEETAINQTETVPQESPQQMDEFLLAITTSGIWQVNEETQEILQLSNDVLDAPRPYRKGLSPDKKFYAYITGDLNPTLVLLNLETNSRAYETPLSGPNSQIKPNMDAGDPGRSVLLAMQFYGSLAWSPDSTHLAFVAAMDNASTDLYLLNVTDQSLSRLSDESSNAAHINWSPDGRFIEFVTINNFGTGAGVDIDAIWVYDRSQGSTKLLEQATSSGEEFISWIDNESFYINSWNAICSAYNMRTINAVTGAQDMIYDRCFSGIAYDAVGKMGLLAVNEFFIDACQCGEVDDFGTYVFGESMGMGDVGIKIKKFEYINAYGVELLDPGNLFAIYTDEGLTHLFDTTGFPISIPNAVAGLKPFPSPTGAYWAWYPYYGDNTGLMVTDNQSTLFELSASSSGNVVWRDDGNRLYFIESNRILAADAPDFSPSIFAEIPVSEIFVIGK
jgi:WD40 repeat protein